MHGSDKALTQEEKDAQWVRRGKKYKTKYFGALKELFKEVTNDKDCQVEANTKVSGWNEDENCCPNRRARSDQISSLDG